MSWKTVVYWPGVIGALFAGIGTLISVLNAQTLIGALIGAMVVCVGIAVPFVYRGGIYMRDVIEGKKKFGE